MRRITILILAVCLSGCAAKTTVTNLPPGVTQAQVNSWTSAVNDLQQAQTLTHAGLTTVIELNHQTPSVFPDGAPYSNTLMAFGKAEQIEIAAAMFLKTVPNNWSASTTNQVLAYTNQILQQLQTTQAESIVGIKSQASLSQVTTLITNIVKVINLVQSLTQTPLAWRANNVVYA